jgi:LuxR family transcriptional regulator, maltose regulon positive regulatory protein
MLEALERGNLFVVPLDDKRQWYRYYQLFADVLQARLRLELPTVRVVHERASAWYERHGQQYDAIRHALAASNFERAAGLIELVARGMVRSHQSGRLREWIKALPDEVVRVTPVLCTYLLCLFDPGTPRNDAGGRALERRRTLARRWGGHGWRTQNVGGNARC